MCQRDHWESRRKAEWSASPYPCAQCGTAITPQQAAGRRRSYCTATCKQAAARARIRRNPAGAVMAARERFVTAWQRALTAVNAWVVLDAHGAPVGAAYNQATNVLQDASLHRRGEDRVDQAHSLCDLWPRRTAVWRRAGQVSCCSGGVDGVVELVEGRTKPALDCLRGSPRSGKGGNGGPAQAREGSGTSGGNSETTPGRGIGLGQGLHQIVPVGLQPVLGQFPLHRNVTPIGLCAILLVSQAFSKSPVELVQLFDATLPIAPKRET